ncbi:hypothetical protein RR42_s0649 [Cupriavidus basilensis]|uniref:Uncharacterized protein n=1 Tax=Cupriavidus basilensis TaxID=68895 RepID=A0A0C4YI07_9BURK|nr:hypothetical protein RR42_s0649 [Cupriavidus basilensis]
MAGSASPVWTLPCACPAVTTAIVIINASAADHLKRLIASSF